MSKRHLILNDKDVELLLVALCNYKYEWCVPGSKKDRQVDMFIDKYFNEDDYLLSHLY